MAKKQEINQLIEELLPLIDKTGDLSKEDIDNLAGKVFKLALLNKQRLDELEVTVKQAEITVEELKGKIGEYETSIAMAEAFLIENDLYESFLVFSDEVIQDFMKKKKTHLTLVQ